MYGRAVAALVALAIFCIAPAGPASGHAAKKRCRYVVKVIHGHRRKVRVCTKPKPKPAAVKNVTLQLDTAHAASATLTADGGAVSVVTSSGTKLTLTVPKNAVAGGTQVTVTPVTSIGGLAGKLVAAVQFAPEGLVLSKPATLTVQGSATKPAAVVWTGNGQYVERYPISQSASGRIQISLLHFSGAGVYDGPPEGLTDPRDAQKALYQQVVLPKMQGALNNDDQIGAALEIYISWSKTFEMIGDPSFMASERAGLQRLLKQVLVNAVNRSYERCKSQHDAGNEMSKLNGYARSAIGMASLLESQQASQDIYDLASDRLQKCGTFELDFETMLTGSTVTSDGQASATYAIHVRVLGLRIHAIGSTTDQVVPPPATQQVEYLTWEYLSAPEQDGDCKHISANGVQLRQPFRVDRLDIAPDDAQLNLDIWTGDPQELAAWQPCGIVVEGPNPQAASFYQTLFTDVLHASEREGDDVRVSGWSILKGQVYARKTYSQTVQYNPPSGISGPVTEQTTLDLKHTPE